MLRALAFDIVYGVMEQQKQSDGLFHALVETDGKRKPLGGQEKAFLRRLAYGTIERIIYLDAVIDRYANIPVKKMKPAVRTALRMGAYEILYMDAVPAAATCNEMVSLSKKKKCAHASGFVNAVLRNIAKADKEELQREIESGAETGEKRLSLRYSMPEDIVHMMIRSYGKKTAEKIFAFFYEDRPVTIRVHTMNASKEQVRRELIQAGMSVEDGIYAETALLVTNAGKIESLPGFAEGHFVVQDESSMLPVLVSGIRPGDVVLDACSSPGGKAFHAVDVMKGNGLVSARDVSEQKLHRLMENAARLHAENIEIKVWDAALPDEEWRERAEVVLVDAPCSGIGVIGKKPDIKYHAMHNAETLPEVQKKIAAGAAAAVKPGGVLVYSTCTVNARENEEIAAWIAENLPFEPVSLDEYLPKALQNGMTKRGMLQILPGIQKSDGFFVAKFVRKQ